MKIHIFYSHYNVEGKGYKYRPSWFDYESCFKNFLSTIKDKNIDLHLVMDGKVDNNWIGKYRQHYILHEIEGGSNEKAVKTMYNIVKSIGDNIANNDLIYFVENDYLHVDGWVEKIINLFSIYNNLDYVSLYDHGDKYFHSNYDDLVSKIFISSTHHWRTIPSTCGSYITTKQTFMEDYDIQIGEIIPMGDHYKWLWLNEHKNRFVFTPIPGLSTHCMEGLLSPTINWEQINNQTKI
jgi:hypothetical protein